MQSVKPDKKNTPQSVEPAENTTQSVEPDDQKKINFYITRHATSVNNAAKDITEKKFDPVLDKSGIINTANIIDSYHSNFQKVSSVVFVSPLIRTWLTAAILYGAKTEHLKLVVAPFLKELHKKKYLYTWCSGNHPTSFKDTIEAFKTELQNIAQLYPYIQLPTDIRVSVLNEFGKHDQTFAFFQKASETAWALVDNKSRYKEVDPFNTKNQTCDCSRTWRNNNTDKTDWNIRAYECDGNINAFMEYMNFTLKRESSIETTTVNYNFCRVIAHSAIMRKFVINNVTNDVTNDEDDEDEDEDGAWEHNPLFYGEKKKKNTSSSEEMLEKPLSMEMLEKPLSMEMLKSCKTLYNAASDLASITSNGDALSFLKDVDEIFQQQKNQNSYQLVELLSELKKKEYDLNITNGRKVYSEIWDGKDDTDKKIEKLRTLNEKVQKLISDGFLKYFNPRIVDRYKNRLQLSEICNALYDEPKKSICELHTRLMRGGRYNLSETVRNTFYRSLCELLKEHVTFSNKYYKPDNPREPIDKNLAIARHITSENCGTLVVYCDKEYDYIHGYAMLEQKMKKPAEMLLLACESCDLTLYISEKKRKILITKISKSLITERKKAGGGAKTTRRNRCHNARYTHQNRRRSTQRRRVQQRRRTRTNVKTRRRQSTLRARRRTMRK